MSALDWRVSGSYFEVCNCEAICPCRRRGGQKLSSGSTYGVCGFALSWFITDGHHGTTSLAGRAVVLAGRYDDDDPGKPWTLCLYIAGSAADVQHSALADIFLGHFDGTPFRNFAHSIGEVRAIRKASIQLDHRPGRWFMRAGRFVTAQASTAVASELPISCGIPGHDHPGQEVMADEMRVDDDPLKWSVHGR